jgi:hypothetical protein
LAVLRKIFVLAAAVLACAWAAYAGDAVTIVGKGDGPATVIDKDGSVETIRFPRNSELNEQGKANDVARAASEKEAAEASQRDAEAKKKAAEAAEAQRKKDEEAKAKQAALEAKALKEKEVNRKKEIAHYVDKDYTYGPGSARKVDRTAAVVNRKKKERDEVESTTGSPKITVSGQTRIRSNNFAR